MANKAAFEEKSRKAETGQAEERLDLAYQTHALAQMLLAHCMNARSWVAPSVPFPGQGAFSPYQAQDPHRGWSPTHGAAPYFGASPCYGVACCSAPAAQACQPTVPAMGLYWPEPVAMAPVMAPPIWASPFTGFIKP